ncbi:unnamed protein product [Rhizoctonia solani]|uniref:Uncharacterized protein n=1 Tax=Rhizoctonia solani TaxID=456999 RepID=A0A8H3AD27_9AGAM|nr:unnamed protein product [Rhizoctonia solani]
MFSTITNMLPSLSLQGDKDQPSPGTNMINPFDKLMAVKRRFEGARTSTSVEPEPEEPEERREERKERRKQKPLNETFVVVRPPPNISNHPLNLQLQLIPPTIPNRTARSASLSTTASTSSGGERSYAAAGGVPNVPSAGLQSRKETAEPEEELLNRRANRSDLSLFYSSMGSSASVTSFSTVASTATNSGARRIIPLYNLSAHNVLQNTVLDAGTDATVSRFRKRGIDIVGLGVLEPVEVHGPLPTGVVTSCHPDVEPSDAGHSNLGHGVSESDHSPPSQSGHLGSYVRESAVREPARELVVRDPYLRGRPSQSNLRRTPSPSQLSQVYIPEEIPKESAGKKFFGKLFKKKDPVPIPTSPGLLSPIMKPRGLAQPPRPISTHSARPASVVSVVPPTPSTIAPSSPIITPYLQPPVLGTQATLRCETYPPTGRPAAYVWVLRKWTKGGGMFSGGVEMDRVGVEVRFEWVRAKKKRERGEGHSHSRSPAERPVSIVSVEETLALPEGGSYRSVSPDPRARQKSASPTKRVLSSSDDGDSDPEDSETPWSCTLRIVPLDNSSSPLKLRLAHLVPAPHHPKVIGQFKMPFPLPDVSIQELELVPRSAQDPFGMDVKQGGGEMVMSSEEIKDVVCTTALWLMVREGFGGLSGKKRKGDGWKIRS